MKGVRTLFQVDLLEQYGELPFNLEFFMDMQDLARLVPFLDAPPADPDKKRHGDQDRDDSEPEPPTPSVFVVRRRRLHAAMCELVDDFGLVAYETLNIQEATSVARVLARIDKSNGYIFGATESNSSAAAKYAGSLFRDIPVDSEMHSERTFFVQERYQMS
jgi:hypothetical protein